MNQQETRADRDIRIAWQSRGMVGHTDVRRFIRTVDRICREFGQLTDEQIRGMRFEERHEVWMTYITVYNRHQSQRRRAQQRGSPTHFTLDDIRRFLVDQEGRCAYCLQNFGEDWHIEHVRPLSKGGSNGPENIVLACHDCNLNKGDKTPEEWTNRWYLTELTVTDLKFTGQLWKRRFLGKEGGADEQPQPSRWANYPGPETYRTPSGERRAAHHRTRY